MRFDVAPYLHVPTRNLWRPTWVWLCYMLPTYLKRWPTPQLPAPAATVLPTYPKIHEFTSQVHFSQFFPRPPTDFNCHATCSEQ